LPLPIIGRRQQKSEPYHTMVGFGFLFVQFIGLSLSDCRTICLCYFVFYSFHIKSSYFKKYRVPPPVGDGTLGF